MTPNDATLIAEWTAEEQAPFRGWDFGHIRERYVEERPPWSYEELAREVLRGARSGVDLGTGGGELLASLRDAFPARMVATEAYPPNLAVARERLEPLGVTVVPYQANETTSLLPFANASFDVILSRHEAYDAREVARVLTPGGVFLTQQVDGRSHADLLARFGTQPQWPEVTVERLSEQLRATGLVIGDARSWWGHIAFRDVGALVYYLKAVPWEVPGFSVARFAGALLELQRLLLAEGTLRFAEGRFIIQARKRHQRGHEHGEQQDARA